MEFDINSRSHTESITDEEWQIASGVIRFDHESEELTFPPEFRMQDLIDSLPYINAIVKRYLYRNRKLEKCEVLTGKKRVVFRYHSPERKLYIALLGRDGDTFRAYHSLPFMGIYRMLTHLRLVNHDERSAFLFEKSDTPR